MSKTDHDRNLLFGILALQMDFISRDALVAAMHAWVLAKEKSLGEILLEQGVLPQARRELLEALVEEHLKQHSNDPQQSLAAVSSIGSVEEDLKQLDDGEVNATLAFVAKARPERSLGERTTTVGSATSAGTRFRILRPYAEGGLGKVSVARDEELSREVALKEIKARHADNPDSRARFLLEAEITGGLEHPGIVPVYGLGQYADGRPFYAMRFIRGDSLQEAIDRYHASRSGKVRPRRTRRGTPQAPRAFSRRLQRDRLRPQPGRPAPRPEARQHHAGKVRRNARRRLGSGQGGRPAGGGERRERRPAQTFLRQRVGDARWGRPWGRRST